MATYRAIAASEVDPDSPVTATLMQALADNPVAIAEGDPTAPRVVAAATGLSVLSGTGNPITLTDYSAAGIAQIELFGLNSSGGVATSVTLSVSTDGVVFTGSEIVLGIGTNSNGHSSIYVDLTTRTVTRAFMDWGPAGSGTPGTSSSVIAGAGTISHIRLTATGGTPTITAISTTNA